MKLSNTSAFLRSTATALVFVLGTVLTSVGATRQDISHHSHHGCEHAVNVAAKTKCSKCNGTGKVECGAPGCGLGCTKGYYQEEYVESCSWCKGKGKGLIKDCSVCKGTGEKRGIKKKKCSVCNGKGKVSCSSCWGTGKVG